MAVLKKINSDFKNKETQVFFFYIPVRFEIETYRAKNTFENYFGIEKYDLNEPVNKLIECAEQNNLNFFSLKNLFIKEKTGLYNKYGDHWSPKATNLTANFIAKLIS